jgi:type IV pilus biogenesis protein CpaD/CtpE
MSLAKILLIPAVLSVGLSGCVENQMTLGSNFGYAVHQEVVAQIADPTARYSGQPAPGSDSGRVALAQDHYRTGKVIAPATTGVSGIAPISATASQ